jgi:glycine dehydrogenase subunit 2
MDAFVEAMLSVADEAESDPDKVRDAPHETVLARLDETRAARFPVLTWSPRKSEKGPDARQTAG